MHQMILNLLLFKLVFMSSYTRNAAIKSNNTRSSTFEYNTSFSKNYDDKNDKIILDSRSVCRKCKLFLNIDDPRNLIVDYDPNRLFKGVFVCQRCKRRKMRNKK